MPIQLIQSGATFDVYAWGDEEHCDVLKFLERLDADGNSDADRLRYLIHRTANHGPPESTQHCRDLGDGIYEFKAPKSARLLWFYERGSVIICTHGFTGKRGKGKTPPSEKGRALSVRRERERERRNV